MEDEVGTLEQQLQDERHASKAQVLELVTHLKAQQKQFEIAEEEKATIQVRFVKMKFIRVFIISSLQTELDNLHRANAESQVSSGSLNVKLERATLQLDGERSKNADLERTNEELKLSNEDLKRQVAKWQSLESKGDTEIESSRKKCVELEVQLQAVQSQLSKREEEDAKMQKRLEKSKQRIQEWQVCCVIFSSLLLSHRYIGTCNFIPRGSGRMEEKVWKTGEGYEEVRSSQANPRYGS